MLHENRFEIPSIEELLGDTNVIVTELDERELAELDDFNTNATAQAVEQIEDELRLMESFDADARALNVSAMSDESLADLAERVRRELSRRMGLNRSVA